MSDTDLLAMRGQLAEIQRQLLSLQQRTPDPEAVAAAQAEVSSTLARLVRTGADNGEDLRKLASRVDQLKVKLDEAMTSFAQVEASLASAHEELVVVQDALHQLQSSAGGEGSPGKTTFPSTPQELYQSSYNDFLRANYDLAILGFRKFLDTYPAHELADNAQYWIGECYFNQQRFQQAISEFDRVLDGYPSSERLASALLRKGYAYVELGDSDAGRRTLQAVVDRFPNSDEAILAKRQLSSLGS